jgi:hypothetical protein
MSRLAELLAVDTSVTSRHVAHAARRGWITRSPDLADRRSQILRLTPAGHDLLDELTRRTTEMFAYTLADWTDGEVGQLSALLGRLRDSFSDSREWHYEGPDPDADPAPEPEPEPDADPDADPGTGPGMGPAFTAPVPPTTRTPTR